MEFAKFKWSDRREPKPAPAARVADQAMLNYGPELEAICQVESEAAVALGTLVALLGQDRPDQLMRCRGRHSSARVCAR